MNVNVIEDKVNISLEVKTMTNFEHIKQMSVEEMANKILSCISSDPCDYCQYRGSSNCKGYHCGHLSDEDIIIEWLESKADDNGR